MELIGYSLGDLVLSAMTDPTSLIAQADSVRRVVRHQENKGRSVPQLAAAEATLRALAALAQRITVEAANDGTDLPGDIGDEMLRILRLPVVKA